MNRNEIIRITNLALLLSMALEAGTGLILFFRLLIARPKIFMAIVEIHEYNGLLLVVLVSVHVALYWGRVRSQFFKNVKR